MAHALSDRRVFISRAPLCLMHPYGYSCPSHVPFCYNEWQSASSTLPSGPSTYDNLEAAVRVTSIARQDVWAEDLSSFNCYGRDRISASSWKCSARKSLWDLEQEDLPALARFWAAAPGGPPRRASAQTAAQISP